MHEAVTLHAQKCAALQLWPTKAILADCKEHLEAQLHMPPQDDDAEHTCAESIVMLYGPS